jgi:6-pyruvoyltetrahydropterin/6-carboxytetrahydropterin synthase
MRAITKIFEFEAAHRLLNYRGVCANLHGHRWRLEVSVKQIADQLDDQDMIMDFVDLKGIVMAKVINKLDHLYINDVLGNKQQPTAEVMVEWMAKQIQTMLPEGILLRRLKLWETSTSYIEWRP